MIEETAPRLGYRPALDGVRAIAILLVLGNHVDPLIGHSLPGGHIGVDVFFVLSGFLITTLLLERADEPLRRFYVRRGLCLLPALYVLLIVVTLIVALREPAEMDDYLRADFFAVTYLTNWAMAFNWFYAPYLSHLWTLAVEEQFYIVFPVLLYFAMRHWRNRALQIVLTVAVLSLLWRSVLGRPRRGPGFHRQCWTAPRHVARRFGVGSRTLQRDDVPAVGAVVASRARGPSRHGDRVIE